MYMYFLDNKGLQHNIDFITSDQHFGHENIIKYTNRSFATVEEMDKALVDSWNTVVSDGDTVLHLGDVALGKLEDTLKALNLCNGKKFLIPGNHDAISSIKSPNYREKHKPTYEKYFEILPDTPLSLFAVDDNGVEHPVYASHYPHDSGAEYDKKYRKKGLLVSPSEPLIHGHTHQKEKVTGNTNSAFSYHVGADAHGNVPVNVKEILEVFFR